VNCHCVLVAAVDELRERVDTVGALVVDTVEVERSERIVGGSHDEQTGEPAVPVLEGIPHASGFEGGQRFGGVPAKVAPFGAELVRTPLGGSAVESLLGAGGSSISGEAARPVAYAMRLAAPGPLGSERH
jgi:hypothetical protein